MTDAAFDSWVERARNLPIERVIEQRGIRRNGKTDRNGPCPVCGGTDRFSINTTKSVWNCRRCGVGGDVIRLVQHLDGINFIAACTTLAGEPPPKPNGKHRAAAGPERVVAARFDYTDESGNLLFQVERVEYQNADGTFVLNKEGKRKKAFFPRRPYGRVESRQQDQRWIFGHSAGVYLRGRDGNFYATNKERLERWKDAETIEVDACPHVPYRLPELIEAVATQRTILIVEGEAKVELLQSWNMPATCCAGGAKKWRVEHSKHLRGADVVLVPDNDDAGWEHIHQVGAALKGIAARIDNRLGDNWRVLLAIADLAGEKLAEQARKAAMKLSRVADVASTGTRLLADIRAIFYGSEEGDKPLVEPLERISSADLVARLAANPESPWAEWKGGKPITQAQLARALKSFGIGSEVIRLPSGNTPRGYQRSQFEDAWERYL